MLKNFYFKLTILLRFNLFK